MKMQMIGSDMNIEQVTTTMNALAVQGSTATHQLGSLYNYVVARKLAELAGYRTAREYFNKNVKTISQATLSLYGSVAAKFPEEVCTQYGMYRLRALLSYVDATGAVLGDPGLFAIDVPQDDGKVVTKSFTECSVDEVERATRAKKAPPPARVPVPDQARMLFFEDSIYRNFNGVAPVRLTSSSEDGTTYLTVQSVPMAQVPRLIKALQEGLEAQPSLVAR
jgi:hypothetical protein